jgi:hypothetical protein
MNLKFYDSLKRRDFENGSVIKERDALLAENARLRVQIQQLTGGAADLQRAIEDPTAMCLSDRLEKLERQRDRLLEALKIMRESTYQSHSGHWDSTQQYGAGCPECIRARSGLAS